MNKILKSKVASILFSLVLVLALSFSFATSTSAAYTPLHTDQADTLHTLGLFAGTGSGYSLERQATRVEGAIMLVRLLGKEDEALDSNYSYPFTDVPSYAQKYVAYCYHNNLTYGVSSTKYGTTQLMTNNQYITFVLRALGYSDTSGDFNYKTANTKATSIGLLSSSEWSEMSSYSAVYRDHIVLISYNALFTKMKNNSATLLDKLYKEDFAISLSDIIAASNNDSRIYAYYKSITPSTPTPTPVPTVMANPVDYITKNIQPAIVKVVVYDCFGEAYAVGSGFIVDSSGIVVTNYHVIDGAMYAKVFLPDGTSYKVDKVYDYSSYNDYAVLKINATGLPTVSIGNSAAVKSGDACYTAGYPGGGAFAVSQGSVLNPSYYFDSVCYVLSDAVISPGSSGGVLLNNCGQVIGITCGILTSDVNQLYVAIPIDAYKIWTMHDYTLSSIINKEYGIWYLYENDMPSSSGTRLLTLPARVGGGISGVYTGAGIVGSFNSGSETDRYKFTITQNLTFDLMFFINDSELTQYYVPATVTVTDSNGNVVATAQLAQADDINCLYAEFSLAPGTYTINVTAYNSSQLSGAQYLMMLYY